MSEFRSGDLVRLRNTDLLFYVEKIEPTGRIVCSWYDLDRGKTFYQNFSPHELELQN
jgi:hypothetical protein